MTRESRCLCGHRSKEHKGGLGACCGGPSRCPCSAFFLVIAEGAWVIKCRCKHKHTEHDPSRAPYGCRDPKCGGGKCSAFDSPWVCNCGHGWKRHGMKDADETAIVKLSGGARHVVRMDGLPAKLR